jgi:uncharacterized protein (TIGR03000 family)
VVVEPGAPATNGAPRPRKGADDEEQAPPPKKSTRLDSDPDRARMIVEVPDDAKLFVDGQLMKTTSSRRVFLTPRLQPGQAYFYDLKAEVSRDGDTRTENRRIIVRAGETARASFRRLDDEAQSETAAVSR